MLRYLVSRILLTLPTLLVITLLAFTLVRLIPGDTVDAMVAGGLGGSASADEAKDTIRRELGLDRSVSEQFIAWLIGWPQKVGVVLETRDGGSSWKPIGSNRAKHFQSVRFVTKTVGWGVTRDGLIYKTSNGGRNWSLELEGSDYKINQVAFVDKSTGWAVGERGVTAYTNESIRAIARQMNENPKIASLLNQVGPESEQSPGDMSYVVEIMAVIRERVTLNLPDDDLAAIVTGLPTSNRGKRYPWLPVPSGTTEDLNDIVHVPGTFWAIGDNGVVIRTNDAASSWGRSVARVDHDFLAVTFADASNGWIVGNKGVILKTSDGGDSWQVEECGQDVDLVDIAATGDGLVWAVGKQGRVCYRRNSDEGWSQKRVAGDDSDLSSIQFIDSANGIVLGDGGVILRSQKTGTTWEPVVIHTTTQNDDTGEMDYAGLYLLDTRRGWATGWRTQWKWGVVGGNLGTSLLSKRSAVSEISRALPISALMGFMSLVMALSIAIPVGVMAAARQNSIQDYVGRSITVMGLAVPSFWVATMVVVFPALWWGWTPPLSFPGWGSVAVLSYLALPAAVEALPRMAGVMRMTRSMTLEVLGQDYIRTAWSKGLSERVILARHAIKNAMVPVVSFMGLQIAGIIGELVVIENIFNVPGIGRLLFASINARDFVLVQACIVVLGVIVLFVNLVTDLTYVYLDPRLRDQLKSERARKSVS